MKNPPGESFINPQSVCSIFRKHLSPKALSRKMAKVFKSAADPRDHRRIYTFVSRCLNVGICDVYLESAVTFRVRRISL